MIVCSHSNLEEIPPDGIGPGQDRKLPSDMATYPNR